MKEETCDPLLYDAFIDIAFKFTYVIVISIVIVFLSYTDIANTAIPGWLPDPIAVLIAYLLLPFPYSLLLYFLHGGLGRTFKVLR